MTAFRNLDEYQRDRRATDPEYARAIRTNDTLYMMEFQRVEVNLWVSERHNATLYYDFGGVMRLAIWRGNKLLLSGGAENFHQLQNLLTCV